MAYNTVFYVQSTKDTVPASATVTGKISTIGTKVIGDGTLFTTQFQIFDFVYVAGQSEVRKVVNIVSDTEMTIDIPFTSDVPSGLVSTISITNPGTGYSDSSGVATTGGTGTGLTVDITQTAGVIDTVVINNPGSGYTIGDVVTITTGNADATIEVTTVVMTAYKLVKRFQSTKITIDNIGGGSALVDGATLGNGKGVIFEKQPYGSSRAITDFLDPVVLDADASDCNVTLVR